MLKAYYNEFDPYAAQWLRNLIAAGHIAPGDVDQRSIEDVKPGDLTGYTQCHFFAGIGVWSYALRRAGWADSRPVWTGSCPCQPFSAAGKRNGFADERHLWPAWFHLISQCRPSIIFGEQVAGKNVDPWIDLVQDDMEAMAYAFGALPFTASSVGAPNIRERLYWVADSNSSGRYGVNSLLYRDQSGRIEENCYETARSRKSACIWDSAQWSAGADGKWRPIEPGFVPLVNGNPKGMAELRAYGNSLNTEAAVAFIECYLES